MLSQDLTIKKCIKGKLHIFDYYKDDAFCNEAGKHLVLIELYISLGDFLQKYFYNDDLCGNCKDILLSKMADEVGEILKNKTK